MKNGKLLIVLLFLTVPAFAQLEDRFGFLDQTEITKYAEPFGTSLGMAFNSASYHTADGKPQQFTEMKVLHIMVPEVI
jgi:hypothetical protein